MRDSVLAFISVALFAATAFAADFSNAERQALERAAEAYQNNREAFPNIQCKFTVAVGEATSLEAVIAGEALRNLQQAHGIWIVRGDATRLEMNWAPNVRPEHRELPDGRAVVCTLLPAMRLLQNQSFTLDYDQECGLGTITPRSAAPSGVTLTPFDMGTMGDNEEMNPAADIRQALNDGRIRILSAERNRLASIRYRIEHTVQDEPDASWYEECMIDPARGHLWVRSRSVGKNDASELVVTAAQMCSNNRWFPMRSVSVRGTNGEPPFHVREITVQFLDVDKVPHDEDLTIDLPEGAYLNDFHSLGSQFFLASAKKVTIPDLQKIHAASQQGVAERKAERN